MVALAGDIVFNSVILIDWKYGECLVSGRVIIVIVILAVTHLKFESLIAIHDVMDCKIIDKTVRSGSEPITLVHFDEHVALFEIIRPFT